MCPTDGQKVRQQQQYLSRLNGEGWLTLEVVVVEAGEVSHFRHDQRRRVDAQGQLLLDSGGNPVQVISCCQLAQLLLQFELKHCKHNYFTAEANLRLDCFFDKMLKLTGNPLKLKA